MAISALECSAVILAGGRSRRMGTCKALLPWQGGTLVRHIARQLGSFEEVWLSANDPAVKAAVALPCVEDRYADAGPLAGIHAALSVSQKDYLLCVPCDLPWFQETVPMLLLQHMHDGVQAMVCRDSTGRLHPLCGIYSRSVLPALCRQLEAGEGRVRSFLDTITWTYLDTAPYCPDQVFYNMNTPESYHLLGAPDKN